MSFCLEIGWSLNQGGWLALRSKVKGVSDNSKLTMHALRMAHEWILVPAGL